MYPSQTQPAATETAAPAPLPVTETATLPAATVTPASTQTGLSIEQIRMLDTRRGWGAGRPVDGGPPEILRTEDGAKTWSLVTPASAERSPEGQVVAAFLDAEHAWAVFTHSPTQREVGARVWRTSDGGRSWQSTDIDTSLLMMEFFDVGQIGFSNAQHGWLLVHLGVGMSHDYVAVLTTSDGGESWQYVVDPEKNNLPMSCYKDSIWFTDAQHGFAVGTCGGVMSGLYFHETVDGGRTWQMVELPAPAEKPDAFTSYESVCEGKDVRFSGQRGQVLVRCYNPAGTDMRWLYTTQDGGVSWEQSLLPGPWGSLAMDDPSEGWYFAQPAADQTAGTRIFHTLDGGGTWEQISTVNWSGEASFADSQHGWAIARSAERIALVHSADGGVTWELMNPLTAP